MTNILINPNDTKKQRDAIIEFLNTGDVVPGSMPGVGPIP
jgi:hypothetical protein